MRVVTVFFILFLTACASSPNDPITAVYDCANGQRLDIVFEPGKAIITTDNGTMATLEQKVTASGFRYHDDKYGQDLRGKGREATWKPRWRGATRCIAR